MPSIFSASIARSQVATCSSLTSGLPGVVTTVDTENESPS